jgi:hypothetical protein
LVSKVWILRNKKTLFNVQNAQVVGGYKIGKLMDGFIVQADTSCMYMVGFDLHM